MTVPKRKPFAKRKPPKKPVQKKEEIEKHLKAINAALGIDETSPEAESIAQATEQVETQEETTEASHASDLLGGAATEERSSETETPTTPEPVIEAPAPAVEKPAEAVEAPPSVSTPANMPGEGAISINPAASSSETAPATPAVPSTDAAAMPPMTDQPQMPGAPMGTDGMVPPADGAADFGAAGGEGSKKKKIMESSRGMGINEAGS